MNCRFCDFFNRNDDICKQNSKVNDKNKENIVCGYREEKKRQLIEKENSIEKKLSTFPDLVKLENVEYVNCRYDHEAYPSGMVSNFKKIILTIYLVVGCCCGL